jgi:arginyl-tRNA synthetase
MERAAAEGLPAPSPDAADPALLGEPETRLVLRRLVRYPFLVEKAAAARSPHLLTHELMELAQAIHQFYTRNRVVGAPTPAIGQARLALASAARQAVANGLGLLGVTAPERM